MNNDDMILISVDDHIIEPPDMFLNHLPDKYKLDAPRMVHNLDGSDVWTFRDVVIPNVALTPSPADLRRSTAWSRRASTRSGRVATTLMNGSRT